MGKMEEQVVATLGVVVGVMVTLYLRGTLWHGNGYTSTKEGNEGVAPRGLSVTRLLRQIRFFFPPLLSIGFSSTSAAAAAASFFSVA